MGATASKVINKSLTDIYRERISTILSENTVTASTLVRNDQQIKLNIECGGDGALCGTLNIDQKILANIRIVNSITQEQASQIASLIESDVSNKNSQTMQMVFGFMSSVGEYKSQELTNEFVARVKSIVRENITSTNLTRIMNNTVSTQGVEISLKSAGNCRLAEKGCEINQEIAVDFASQNIINQLVSVVSEDTVITRIVNDNSQEFEIDARGLDNLAKAMTGIAIVIGIVAVIVVGIGIKSSPVGMVASVTKNPGLLVGTGVIVIVVLAVVGYFSFAYFKSLWPFSGNRVLWKCQTVDDPSNPGQKTHACVSSKGGKGYDTREICMASKTCDRYWGCEFDDSGEFTGNCAEYDNALRGPERTREACQAAVKAKEMCTHKWGCERDPDTRLFTGKCTQYKDPALGVWRTEAICLENAQTKGACDNGYTCNQGTKTCREVATDSGFATFRTKSDCESVCVQK